MAPRAQLLQSARRLAIRPKLSGTTYQAPVCLRLAPQRSITADEKPLPKAEPGAKGPNQDQLGHVSEEAAAIGKATGEGGPELEQGTPVQEVRTPRICPTYDSADALSRF